MLLMASRSFTGATEQLASRTRVEEGEWQPIELSSTPRRSASTCVAPRRPSALLHQYWNAPFHEAYIASNRSSNCMM